MQPMVRERNAAHEPREKSEEPHAPVRSPAGQEVPQNGKPEDCEGEGGEGADGPTLIGAGCIGLANGGHERRREERRGDGPAPGAQTHGEEQITLPVFRLQAAQQAHRREHHHHRSEGAGQCGATDACRRGGVVNRPPGLDGARQEENRQRQQGQGRHVRRVVPDHRTEEAAGVPEVLPGEVPVGNQNVRNRSQRIDHGGSETGAGSARQPPRRQE